MRFLLYPEAGVLPESLPDFPAAPATEMKLIMGIGFRESAVINEFEFDEP